PLLFQNSSFQRKQPLTHNGVVTLSVEVASHARLQNRTCRFRVIRLLNDMVLVMNACLRMLCILLVIATG
ncbi:MAG TPA: hypothetical protein VF844_12585, partial [Ktedonobacteraceae bacterium]